MKSSLINKENTVPGAGIRIYLWVWLKGGPKLRIITRVFRSTQKGRGMRQRWLGLLLYGYDAGQPPSSPPPCFLAFSSWKGEKPMGKRVRRGSVSGLRTTSTHAALSR